MTAPQVKRFVDWWNTTRNEPAMFVRHVLGLIIPGAHVRVVIVHKNEPVSLDDWDDNELPLLIEEGRRQLDRQQTRFDRVRTNAQFLFTTALALLIVLATAANHTDGVLTVVWAFGLAAVTLGLLGAASVLVVKSEFGSIDTALFTKSGTAPRRELAEAYAQQVRIGEDTTSARITVYRDAVWLVLLGALVQLAVWITRVWS